MSTIHNTARAERIEAIWWRSRRSYGAAHQCRWPATASVWGQTGGAADATAIGIQGTHSHKYWKTTRQDRDATAAPDKVDRHFTAVEPNRLWLADRRADIGILPGSLFSRDNVEHADLRIKGRALLDGQPPLASLGDQAKLMRREGDGRV
jgi:hypothetical protein